jgi:hypothetical protein
MRQLAVRGEQTIGRHGISIGENQQSTRLGAHVEEGNGNLHAHNR